MAEEVEPVQSATRDIDNIGLSQDWRQEIKRLGKTQFELQEMIRLGFLDQDELEKRVHLVVTREQADQARIDRSAVIQEVQKVNNAIAEVQDVSVAISEIRARRIERVKAERLARKAEQQAGRAERAAAVKYRRRTSPTFLGHGISGKLVFDGGDYDQLAKRGLPVIDTFSAIAEALALTPEQLQWLVYERAAAKSDHYTRFQIPKRSGGMRLISSPKPTLRQAQTWIRKNILGVLEPHSAATAFRPNTSIVDNAQRHASSEIVVKMDLKEFFPSLAFPRVRGYFHSLGYNLGVATVLALLCTDAPRVRITRGSDRDIVAVGERTLPQGACTSPDLANLIAQRLDRRLSAFASKAGWKYTRYADDLVFSTNDSGASPHRVIATVTKIVVDEGFTTNASKTRIMRSPNRQAVTGLIVNDGVRLSRRDLRRIRSYLHHCETEGLSAVSSRIGKDAKAVARGYFAYVYMVSPATALRLRERHPWI